MKEIIKILTLVLLTTECFAMDAIINKIRGNVYVDQRVAKVGQRLSNGQELLAKGRKSLVIVKYNNGSKYMLKNGKLIIEKIETNNSVINLLKGAFFSYVKKKSPNEKLLIKTKTAVMGVRGTKFFISENENESYLCVCDGSVEASNNTGKILVSKNEDVHISSKDSKLNKTKANTSMIEMGLEAFRELGEPVN